jgi:hypothetical protein
MHILVKVFLYKNVRLASPGTRSPGHQKHKIYNQLYLPMAGETLLQSSRLIDSLHKCDLFSRPRESFT